MSRAGRGGSQVRLGHQRNRSPPRPHPPITAPSDTAAVHQSGGRHEQQPGAPTAPAARGGVSAEGGPGAGPLFDPRTPPPLTRRRSHTTRCTPWTAARGDGDKTLQNTRCGRVCVCVCGPLDGDEVHGEGGEGGGVRAVCLRRGCVCVRAAPPPFVSSRRRCGAAPHLPPHAHRPRYPPSPPSRRVRAPAGALVPRSHHAGGGDVRRSRSAAAPVRLVYLGQQHPV